MCVNVCVCVLYVLFWQRTKWQAKSASSYGMRIVLLSSSLLLLLLLLLGLRGGMAPALAKKRYPPACTPWLTPGTVIAADKTQKQRDFYM